LNNARWIALRLLEVDACVIETLRDDELDEMTIPLTETEN